MPLLKLLDQSLVGRAPAFALECEDQAGRRTAFTFGQLEVRSNQLARVLRARGLARGDRIACFLPNRVELIDLWLAAVKLGLVVVPVNALYRERDLTALLRDANPIATITSTALAEFLPPEFGRWDVDTLAQQAGRQPGARLATTTPADSPLALMYTSGTTGEPKGAVLTQANFAANGLSIVNAWELTTEDRYLAALPLTHAHGLANGVHAWLLSGCHMLLPERFEHAKMSRWFEEYGPTLFLGVPAMFTRLVELASSRLQPFPSQLRLAVSGSAPLPAEIQRRFREHFGTTILERYGTTETLGIAANPYRGERRVGTVGHPLAGVELKICDDLGRRVRPDTPGEIWVKGANVCAGYWRRPHETAAAWRDGWFRTDDVGVRSADGYLTLVGRRSETINSGGFKFHPAEIEHLLLEQPGVVEAAVIAGPDRVRGEVPTAYVVVDSTIFDEAAVTRQLATQIASFKRPRRIVRVAALPRTALGKVRRHLLASAPALP